MPADNTSDRMAEIKITSVEMLALYAKYPTAQAMLAQRQEDAKARSKIVRINPYWKLNDT